MPCRFTWNQKNLDYEIETETSLFFSIIAFYLKSKEPRLRDWNIDRRFPAFEDLDSWNQKNLDYEIETMWI